MHVERDGGAVSGPWGPGVGVGVGGAGPAALQRVLGEALGQVGLPGAAGPGHDQPAVLEQQADVVVHHGLGDQRLEHQRVHALLPQTWAVGQGGLVFTSQNTAVVLKRVQEYKCE